MMASRNSGQRRGSQGQRRGSQGQQGRRRSSRRSGASESWRNLTTGLTDAAKALTGGSHHSTFEKVDSVSAVNALQYRCIQQDNLFRAAHDNDMELLELELESAEDNSELVRRTEAGDTAFLLAVLFDSADVALRLLERCPPLLHMVYSRKHYKGQHALHIATVNQNLHLVKEFVRLGADINQPRAVGSFFSPSSPENQVYWGEHVLAFAACTGQKEILEFLLRKGADVSVQDGEGNTILHMLVLQPDRVMARDMYEFVTNLEMAQAHDLEAVANNQGLTPLQLAAFEGNKEVFSLILESRREVHWTYGPVTSSIYKLKELDSFGDCNSVIDVIVRSEAENAYELLDVQPIPQLLSEKWTNFGFFFFMLWMIMYIGYMIIFSLVVFNRPLESSNRTWCACPSTIPVEIPSSCPCDGDLLTVDDGGNLIPVNMTCSTTSLQKRPVFSGAYSTSSDYARLAGELCVLIGAFASILWEAPDLYKRGGKGYFTSVGSGAFHVSSWLFAVLVIIAFIMRLADAAREDVVLSMALITGWIFTLYFARAFRFVGPYIIMCQKMIAGDILRFWLIFIAINVGFSGALSNLFLEASPRPPQEWDSFGMTFVTMFQLATGLTDIEPASYDTATSKNTVVGFLLLYLVIAFILLVNLLIATMGSTHARIEAERHGLWKKQLASVILLLERRIPASWSVRSGFDGGLVGLQPGDWYVRVEEHGTASQAAPERKNFVDVTKLSRAPENMEYLDYSDSDSDGDRPKSTKAATPSPGKLLGSPLRFRKQPKLTLGAALLGSAGVFGSIATPDSIDTENKGLAGLVAPDAEQGKLKSKYMKLSGRTPEKPKSKLFSRSRTAGSLQTSPTAVEGLSYKPYHSSLHDLDRKSSLVLDRQSSCSTLPASVETAAAAAALSSQEIVKVNSDAPSLVQKPLEHSSSAALHDSELDAFV